MYNHAAAIDAELRELHAGAMSQLDRAAERFEAGQKRLYRSDGQPIYGEAEHQQRLDALLGEFDGMTGSVTEAAEQAITDGKAELARMDGSSPMDTLGESELSRANSLALFVREDCESLPSHELAGRVRSALAGTDRVTVILWDRYLGKRLDATRGSTGSDPTTAALFALRRELADRLADSKAKDKRHRADRKIESAKTLTGRVRMARSKVDGGDAAALAAMRERVRSFF